MLKDKVNLFYKTTVCNNIFNKLLKTFFKKNNNKKKLVKKKVVYFNKQNKILRRKN